ncbi:MAG TPA: GAF domain-containing protein [Chloroflexota bacterium]
MAQSTQDSLLRDIAQRAREAAQADRCTIFELAPDRHEVFSRVALGLEEGLEIRLPTTRGVIGFVARTGRPLRLRDAYNDPRFDPSTDERTGYRTKSILCVPVTDDSGAVLGAIQLINKVSGTFSQEDEDVANGFCADVARIIQS